MHNVSKARHSALYLDSYVNHLTNGAISSIENNAGVVRTDYNGKNASKNALSPLNSESFKEATLLKFNQTKRTNLMQSECPRITSNQMFSTR